MVKLVLDTSVIVEYIIRRSPYRSKLEKLLGKQSPSKYRLYITPLTITETLYVVSRIYRAAGILDPNTEALNYIYWIMGRARPINIDEYIAVRAGELKKQLRLSLADCYVIASAQAIEATPLFLKPEKEMHQSINVLRELGVRFLEDLEI